jgi:hypothetical protein
MMYVRGLFVDDAWLFVLPFQLAEEVMLYMHAVDGRSSSAHHMDVCIPQVHLQCYCIHGRI